MKRRKAREPIHAAGGIVIRGHREPLIAIVQLRKYDSWVLPKGKLNRNETPLAAARREVLEEVGHKVYIHEFLGTIAHEVGTRPKIVQFWRMQAIGEPVGELMKDVRAVAWLPLADAIDRLTHSREQVFLRNVGPVALEAAARSVRKGRTAEQTALGTIEPADDLDVEEVAGSFDPEEVAETVGSSSHGPALDAPDPESILEPAETSADKRNAEAAAEPPRQDSINSSGPSGRDGVVERVRLWFRRFSLARQEHAPQPKVGVSRHGRPDEVAQEGDQESA
jgi:8-oxo-dGTP diphosphatase